MRTLLLIAAAACRGLPEPCPEVLDPDAAAARPRYEAPPPNLLLVIADDVGTDLITAYGPGDEAAPTPTLDALAAEGVRFDRAWATPWCSPTRATLATGRFGRRYGLGRALEPLEETAGLPLTEVTLAEVLRDEASTPYARAVLGKWHLDSYLGPASLRAPLDQGFQHHQGPFANLVADHAIDGGPMGYRAWERVTDGVIDHVEGYATSATADDAIAWLDAQGDAPWFLWLAFPAAHSPWSLPPPELHGYGEPSEPSRPLKIRAMVEALDRELGRVLASLPPAVRSRTVIVFVGDNGSPTDAAIRRTERPRKGAVWEGGVHVPLIVAGPGVVAPGRTVDALVQTVDLMPTLAELAGVDAQALGLVLDGTSFAGHLVDADAPAVRQLSYAEAFEANGPGPWFVDQRAVRDARHKLVRRAGRDDALFDLDLDPTEATNLLADAPSAAHRSTAARLGDALTRCFPTGLDPAP